MDYESERYLPIRPQSRLSERDTNHLFQVTFQHDLAPGSIVELVIRIDDSNVNLREMSSYLELADRSFGMLTAEGLRSYAQRRSEQLIASFRPGSLEIIDPSVCHGKACLTGTRVLVSVALDNLAAGVSPAEIVTSYPSITTESVRAALAYAAELAAERVEATPDR